MRAIFVLFDTMNRQFLPPYGNDWVHAPNFSRLAERAATFDNCYAGSMPCVPARRELHTSRYNFLHRSWGPLEPFDDSMPEILKNNSVYTHLASDHYHYWEDGGARYHTRYNSWEFFRGQEGDPWKGQVADPDIPDSARIGRSPTWRHNWVSRSCLQQESDHYQTRTFEPAWSSSRPTATRTVGCCRSRPSTRTSRSSPQADQDLYPHDYDGPHSDWLDYKRVTERPTAVEHVRFEYASLLSMCDHSLGRVLDAMDEHQMWDDTMLIVGTDHGFLLGEHGWWGKAVQPWYDECIHTPLFIWDPRSRVRGERRSSLVQTIDIAPTLLEYFGVERPSDMQGVVLRDVIATDAPVRRAALFGSHGAHINVTDGRYVYMRASASPENQPLYGYTLMSTSMRNRFPTEKLKHAEMVPPFTFTKDCPVLKVPTRGKERPARVRLAAVRPGSRPGTRAPAC